MSSPGIRGRAVRAFARGAPHSVARRKRPMRGRSIVALVLLGFLLVATGVIWRRSHGIAQRLELRALDRERTQLEARKVKLENDIREASSRARLAPIAEQRLDMHVPNDSQVVILPRPTAAPAGRDGSP